MREEGESDDFILFYLCKLKVETVERAHLEQFVLFWCVYASKPPRPRVFTFSIYFVSVLVVSVRWDHSSFHLGRPLRDSRAPLFSDLVKQKQRERREESADLVVVVVVELVDWWIFSTVIAMAASRPMVGTRRYGIEPFVLIESGTASLYRTQQSMLDNTTLIGLSSRCVSFP